MIQNASPLPHASYERFESVREYDAMFDELTARAQQSIRIFDHAPSAAFNSPGRCEELARFLRAGGPSRLHIVLHTVHGAERMSPRLLALLQRFTHVAQARQTPRWARHVYDRFVVFDSLHYLHAFHHAHARFARGTNDIEGAQQLVERFDELWDISQPVFGASVLGL
jgi:hypothetical protein